MTLDDKIRDEKLQYNINRETKISSSSSKIDKYEYLTGQEILPSDQSRMIKQGKFTYSSFEKVFGKQRTTIENQGQKQIKAIKEQKKQLAKYNLGIKKSDYDTEKDRSAFLK